MKRILFLALCLFTAKVYADDTGDLQSMINKGNVTLPANHAPYSITAGIRLVHSLNLNGNTVNCTNSVGAAFIMHSPGVKLSNGELAGTSDAINPSAPAGVEMNADNDTVDHVYIHKFPSYAIYGGDGNSPVITNSKLVDIGYSCMFIVCNKHSIQGGVVANDLFDRSMLDPLKITECALMLRGGQNLSSPGWVVHDNVFKMPLSPKDITSECFEHRRAPNSAIYNNTCIGGSIGISIVGADHVHTYNNKCSQQHEEGIEYANSSYGMINGNVISDELGHGVLIDGFAPSSCQYDTLENNTISRCNDHAVQLFKDTYHIYFIKCNISAQHKTAIYLQGAHDVEIRDCKFTGNGYGTNAIFLDNSAGNVHVKGGTMSGFEHKLFVYGTKQVTTDNVHFDNVKATNNIKESDKNMQNGSTIGNDIRTQ
jgi:hypothetical protein